MEDEPEFENWFDIAIDICNEIGLKEKIHALEDERYQLLAKGHADQMKLNS